VKTPHRPLHLSRRDFLKAGALGSSALFTSCAWPTSTPASPRKPVVSIVKITSDKQTAVRDAIRLLGGMETILEGKTNIMLKPNLVADFADITTKPDIIGFLAELMMEAGKTVSIGEGSAVANGFNLVNGDQCVMDGRHQLDEEIDAMQNAVFDRLGYTELADSLGVDLLGLHTGPMVEVTVPDGLAYETIRLRQELAKIDLLCSVPMMKTHNLAKVTLGMKNLIGTYPGKWYGTLRSGVHDHALSAGSPGLSYEILDIVRVNKLGLVVIDGSTAMEGNGPSQGNIIPMNVIIAGTNPLATDMVAASVMGFHPDEVPHFVCAHGLGMLPRYLEDIEVRGESICCVRQDFAEPEMHTWDEMSPLYRVCQRRILPATVPFPPDSPTIPVPPLE
jgi:uncharacterized protein (DUF362 family)